MPAFLSALRGSWRDLQCSKMEVIGRANEGGGHNELSTDMMTDIGQWVEISKWQLEDAEAECAERIGLVGLSWSHPRFGRFFQKKFREFEPGPVPSTHQTVSK